MNTAERAPVPTERATPPAMPSAAELATHRDALLRYALVHVRNAETAEDLVQATLLAALEGLAGFRGEASVRTWLIGILKRRIVDHVRSRSRAPVALADLAATSGAALDESFLDTLFESGGTWRDRPGAWESPHDSLEQEAFWKALEACIESLPGIAGQVFVLREILGLEADEICKDLSISKSNFWVLMHRSRLRLRGCMDRRWFARTPEG